MRHAKNWYKFAYPWTGVSNRSLCLITGCDKMSSWMVGAFSDCSSGSQAVLQLSVSGLLEGQLSYSYAWATSSPAIQRVGPSVDQTIATDADPDGLERDDEMFTTDPPPKGATSAPSYEDTRSRVGKASGHVSSDGKGPQFRSPPLKMPRKEIYDETPLLTLHSRLGKVGAEREPLGVAGTPVGNFGVGNLMMIRYLTRTTYVWKRSLVPARCG